MAGLKQILFTFYFLFLLSDISQAQEINYKFNPPINTFFNNQQVDSLFYKAAKTVFENNQVPSKVFNERYPKVKQNLYKQTRKEINGKLKAIKERYGKFNRIPTNATEYGYAKEDISNAIHVTIRAKFIEIPELATKLNYHGGDEIRSFHSDITILPDGQLDIVETITIFNAVSDKNKEYNDEGDSYTVETKNNDIKRGIVRYIPSRYYWKKGLNFSTNILFDKITRNGKEEPFKNELQKGTDVVYIGNPDFALDFGVHTYKIYYKANYIIKYGDNNDELYLNINGNGWQMPIDSVSCTVYLPEGAKTISNACYTGAFGSTASKCFNTINYENNSVTFVAKGGLKAEEGLTIATSWPKGYVAEPAKSELLLFAFIDNLGPLFILFVALYLLLRAIYIRVKHKRQSKLNPSKVFPQFEPPQNLDPAAVGVMHKLEHTPRQTIAALIDLAVYKHLAIDVRKEDDVHYYIEDAKETYRGQPPVHHLFSKEALLLKDEPLHTKKGNKALAYFNNAVEDYCEDIIKEDKNDYFKFKKNRTRWSKIMYWGAVVISAVFMLIHYLPDVYTFSYFFGGIIIGFIAAYKIKLNFWVYTKEGRKLIHEIEGFKMFLKTADEQRFNIVNRPDADLLLEKYLPYAIVLDCELEWVENFRNAIAPALELADEGIPKYYVPVGGGLATSTLLGGALDKSENLFYHDYMDSKLSKLRVENPNLPKYPDIDIIRPRVSKKSNLFSAADNTSKIPKGRTSWSSDSNYSSSDSGSSSSSSSDSSSASRGGGFSGGGAGGGGGGGW